MRLTSPAAIATVVLACACAASPTTTPPTSTPEPAVAVAQAAAFVPPVVRGPCRAEAMPEVDMTGLAFAVDDHGAYAAAVVGDGWTFDCHRADRALVRGATADGMASIGITLDPHPEGDPAMGVYLTALVEDAHARLLAAGLTVDARVGPRVVGDDTVLLAARIARDGQSAAHYVLMRGLRTERGVLRYTALAWSATPDDVEAEMDALYRASRALMPID